MIGSEAELVRSDIRKRSFRPVGCDSRQVWTVSLPSLHFCYLKYSTPKG